MMSAQDSGQTATWAFGRIMGLSPVALALCHHGLRTVTTLCVLLTVSAGCRAEATEKAPDTPAVASASSSAQAPPVVAKAAPRRGVTLKVVSKGFTQPVLLVFDPAGQRYVVEQTGRMWRLNSKGGKTTPAVLDVNGALYSSRGEMGLLGVAFHPRYPKDHRIFVAYSKPAPKGSKAKLIDAVSSFVVDAKTGVVDAKSERSLFEIEDPAGNHNGGMLAFGPDGYLYIGTGDGGAANDRFKMSRDPSKLLAKMLRVDVNVPASHTGPAYLIPKGNPYVGLKTHREEIWATGLRNPWRYSFDQATGDLWIGDVGQNKYEEVHHQRKSSTGGEDYGWNIVEGDACFQTKTCDKRTLTAPVFVYDHDEGCSITGGYVYRGKLVPELNGHYLFSDYCTGTLWELDPKAKSPQRGKYVRQTLLDTERNISSFGQGPDGEVYLVDHKAGEILLVVPSAGRTGRADPMSAPVRVPNP